MVDRIDFTTDGIEFDGRFVGFPMMVEHVSQILGQGRKTVTDDWDIYTWDGEGFKGFARKGIPFLETAHVYLRDRPGNGHDPVKAFTGAVLREGSSILSSNFRAGWDEGKLYDKVGPFILSDCEYYYEYFIAWRNSNYFADPTASEKRVMEAVAEAEDASGLEVTWSQPPGFGYTLEVGAKGITFAGVPLDLAAPAGQVSVLLGAPRVVSTESGGRAFITSIWDQHGIRASTRDPQRIGRLVLHDALDPDVHADGVPTKPSRIRVLIDGVDPAEAEWSGERSRTHRSLTTGPYEVTRTQRGAASTLEVTSGAASALTPLNDYTHRPLDEPVLAFADLNAKLLVVNELMYHQHVLEPMFDIQDFVAWYPLRAIDPETEGQAVIPEAGAWFQALQVPARFAELITDLVADGGNTVFGEIWPYWDGEDDTFRVASWRDLLQLPNLRRLGIGMTHGTDGLAELRARGVVVDTDDATSLGLYP